MQKELIDLFNESGIRDPELLSGSIYVGIKNGEFVVCFADTWRIWSTIIITEEAIYRLNEYRVRNK